MDIANHLQQLQPSYIREILSAATADGVISLAGGLPASDHFPLALMAEALAALPQQPALFQYGETAGYRPLLDYLSQHYQLPATHGALICTGSQQALDLIARTFLNPGDGVAVEAPSYLGALQVFALAQARVEPVPQQRQGPDLDALETLFAAGRVRIFYAVPDFHNPTGLSWSRATRTAVADLCERYRVTLIEDAPYRELRFSGTPQPMVSSLCPANALVLRSFSKIATPGIRLGVVTGPKHWLEPMTRVKQATDLHSSLPMQAVLLHLLKQPQFSRHIEALRRLYSERYQLLASALRERLGEVCGFDTVEGGMFIWLRLPACDPMAIARAALSKGVAVVPGTVFYTGVQVAPPALRLNFSHARAHAIEEAVTRLAEVILEAQSRILFK